MKKHSIGSRMLSTLLVLAMTLSILPVGVFAAKGDLANVDTGLTGDIDTADTISLPIKILDYEADGMLFEFAESSTEKKVSEFSSIGNDFTASNKSATGDNREPIIKWGSNSSSWKTSDGIQYLQVNPKTNAIITDFGSSNAKAINNVRYLTLVYRTATTSGNISFYVNGSVGGTTDNNTNTYSFTSEGAKNWTYAVYDLKTGTAADCGNVIGVYAKFPMANSGNIDLAYAMYFSDRDLAEAFGQYAITAGSDRGDNRAFGLLRGSRNESGVVDFTGIDDVIGDSVQMLNTYGDSATVKDFSTVDGLGYKLLGTFGLRGIANVGLLESHLSTAGHPVYKKEVVDYLAGLLKSALERNERTTDGWKNYRYVKGNASALFGNQDLASLLRTRIEKNNDNTLKLGSYSDTISKDLIGVWDVAKNIKTCYDAAYFLLNSIFIPGSYNEEQDDYKYLVLSAGTDKESGDKVYVFDGGFADSTSTTTAPGMAIEYNANNKTIQNTSAEGKAHFYYETSNTTTLHPFLPITDRNTASGMTKTPYYQDDGVINGVKKQTTKDTLYKRNFGFAMVSEGEFVYHADDELFFEFEGDDDVYLFINNELVMDIGSAHSIDSVRFNLNDYVTAARNDTLESGTMTEREQRLALEEGQAYSFKFYYMERHSYGSNIRICTNIRVTDPAMKAEKYAWQNGAQLAYGSIINENEIVEYGFGIVNPVDEDKTDGIEVEPIINLTYTDNEIGVVLSCNDGLQITGDRDRVLDKNGGELDVSDLTVCLYDSDNKMVKEYPIATQNDLKSILADPGRVAAAADHAVGLLEGYKLVIRGIGYRLSPDQIEKAVFDNTVFTTSVGLISSKPLQGQASMRVFVPSDPMYYQWAGHELVVSVDKFVGDVLAAASQSDNILNNKVPDLTVAKITEFTVANQYVTVNADNSMTIKFPSAGSQVFYVTLKYSGHNETVRIPVLVNIADVKDSYVVLDYGLPVDISVDDLVGLGDNLSIPGRDTGSTILAIGSNGAYSLNEITFTSATSVDGKYGTFTFNNGVITYTPDAFIEGIEDSIQIAVNVYETGTNTSKITGMLNINKEVEMYKTITIVPANVMYYEDDFGGIEYTGEANIVEAPGTTASLRQSADQNMPYGYDPVYADGENLDNTDVSGGSLHTIALDGSDIFTFTFIGTGFELIAQTNAKDSGTIVVDKGAPETEDDVPAPTSESGETGESALSDAAQLEVLVESTPVVSPLSMSGESLFAAAPSAQTKLYPVIMEFDNGANGGNEAITQVPVIRIDDMDWAIHTVTIRGIQAYKYTTDASGNVSKEPIETYLYFDGLRIFQPLTDAVGNKYYNVNEQSAQFKEIRDLVMTGYVGLATETDGEYKVATEKSVITWTENYSNESNNDKEATKEEIAVNKVESIDEYLIKGPNNEVYMIDDTTSGLKSALFFFVDGNTVKENAQVQVAVRALDLGLFYGANSDGLHAEIQCSILENKVQKWQKLELIQSGTEQYYTIDVKNCPVDEKTGNYMVMLRIVNEDGTYGMVSYSSLKLTGGAALYKGWTVKLDGTFNNGIYDNGESGDKLESSENGNSVANLISAQLRSDLVVTGPVNKFPTKPSTPEIDDPFQNLPETNDPETDDDNTNDGDEESSKPSNFDLLKLFTLTAIAGEGGTITPEGDLIIAFGASRTFKFIPDEGYEIADVLVNGKSVGAVEKYVLKAAHADTVVEVLFREIPEAAADAEAAAEEAAG